MRLFFSLHLRNFKQLLVIIAIVGFCISLPAQASAATTSAAPNACKNTVSNTTSGTSDNDPFSPDLGYNQLKCLLPDSSIGSLGALFLTAWNWASTAVGILAFLGILVTGIMYITAGGDPDKAKKAQQNLIWIVTGIVIWLVSFLVLGGIRDLLVSGGKLKFDTTTSDSANTTNNDTSKTAPSSQLTNAASVVLIQAGTISPATLKITQNTTVIWKNADVTTHILELNAALSNGTALSVINPTPGQTQNYLFTIPGKYVYEEKDANGTTFRTQTITVTASSALATSCPAQLTTSTGSQIAIANNGYSPSTLNVIVGTEVTWTNYDAITHSVTDDATQSTASGPSNTRLSSDTEMRFIFSSPGKFTYYDERNPNYRYLVCVYPKTPILIPSPSPTPSKQFQDFRDSGPQAFKPQPLNNKVTI